MKNDGWQLTPRQWEFMDKHRPTIEGAYAADDMTFLDILERSYGYKKLFADMPWDEAYDRLECMEDER